METAILVGLKGPAGRSDGLDELRELALTAGARVVGEILQDRKQPDAAFFVGRGKAEEVREEVVDSGAQIVIFDEELSPAQARNLERVLEIPVVDRSSLILDIFARRARTREGKLQVELAQLNYRLSRLTGRGSSLSRLGGGIGTRGPGETQLEVDRRRVRSRIRKLESELDQVKKQRSLHRARRLRGQLQTVALVGYTNAGKSTLFESLCGEGTKVSRRVFSTLDPLVRRIQIDGKPFLISDTVGFIRKLPPDLVRAFRATLEEVEAAALILHVVDASDPESAEKIAVVNRVLAEIDCGDHPQVLVYNKADLIPKGVRLPGPGILVSALKGEGIEGLKTRILQTSRPSLAVSDRRSSTQILRSS